MNHLITVNDLVEAYRSDMAVVTIPGAWSTQFVPLGMIESWIAYLMDYPELDYVTPEMMTEARGTK